MTPEASFNANQEVFGLINDSLQIYDIKRDTIRLLENTPINQRFQLDDQGFVYKEVIVRSETKQYFKGQSEKMGGITSIGDTVIPFDFRVIRLGLPDEFIAVMGRYRAERYFVYNDSGNIIAETYNVAIIPWTIKNAYWFPVGRARDQLKLQRLVPQRDTSILNEPVVAECGGIRTPPAKSAYVRETLIQMNGDTVIPANDFCWIRSEGKWQRIDTSFQLEAKKYDAVHMNEHWGVIWKKDRAAFVDINGKLISEFKYEGTMDQYLSSSPLIVGYRKNEIDILDNQGNVQNSFKIDKNDKK